MKHQATARRRDDIRARAKTLQLDLTARERRRIRERVRLVSVARRRAKARIRQWAKRERSKVRDGFRAELATALERLRAARARRLGLVRERAELLRGSAKRRFDALRTKRLHELRQEIAEQRLVTDRARDKVRSLRLVSSVERRQESDDEVRSNIEPEYRPIFERVRKMIRGGPRRTRTEAFLEWLGEHPDEVLAMQAARADSDVEELVRARHDAERQQARAGTSGVRAHWRGRKWQLTRAGAGSVLVMRRGKVVVRWAASERDTDWSLGELLRGKPTAEDRSIARAWVDSLDGWEPLDDLADVPF